MGYAWLMLVGLKTWWLARSSTPFLELYMSPRSLLVGFFGGVIVSLLTIAWTVRRLSRLPVRGLLARQTQDDRPATRAATRRSRLAAGLLVAAALIAASAPWLGGAAQAGAFVGSGAWCYRPA